MLHAHKLCPLLWLSLTCPLGCPKAPRSQLYLHGYNCMAGGAWGVISCVRFEAPPEGAAGGGQQGVPTSHLPTAPFSCLQNNCSCCCNLLHILKSSKTEFFSPTPRYFLISSGHNRKGISYNGAVSGEVIGFAKMSSPRLSVPIRDHLSKTWTT